MSEGEFDGIEGADDPGAESPGVGEEELFHGYRLSFNWVNIF